MRMFRRKPTTPTNLIHIHDALCFNNPCICDALRIERERRALKALQADNAHRRKLAIQALDGEQE